MAGGAADGLYTYDLSTADGGPRVPDVDDLGGVEIENGDPPPHKGAERDADMDNVQTQTLTGLCRMGPFCRLWVEWDGAAYVVAAVDAMGTAVTADDFELTPIGTGVVDIEWDDDPNPLPPLERTPRVQLTGGFGSAYAVTLTATSFEVRIHNDAHPAAADDINFCVDLR